MKIISNTKNDSIKRVEEIYKVLKKNDFGYLIEENTFFKNFPFLKDTKRGKYKELPDESIPKRIKDVLEELGPTYIKLGQMLSTRPDLIGVEIAKELESLRDNTPTTPFNEIKEVIEKELGKPINEIYKEIDEKPLGSASIGQVHKGILLENNKEVAIKVQKPHVRETIESDLKIMKFLSDKIGKYINQTKVYNIPSILTEFERSIFIPYCSFSIIKIYSVMMFCCWFAATTRDCPFRYVFTYPKVFALNPATIMTGVCMVDVCSGVEEIHLVFPPSSHFTVLFDDFIVWIIIHIEIIIKNSIFFHHRRYCGVH